jgi:hypothetical protein
MSPAIETARVRWRRDVSGARAPETGTNTGVPRYCLMAETSLSDEWVVPQCWILVVMLAGAACLFLLLHSLSKPTVLANPGITAYAAPPGTRLLPLPRKSDAPELAELRAEPSSPLDALARAEASENQAKPDVRPPARKRPRVDPREYDQRRFGYAQQRNDGYRDWNNSRGWNGNSGSWF